MKVGEKYYRSVWASLENSVICIIDQTKLPFKFEIKELKTVDEVINSIKNLEVRGAPAIGIAAAYAIWLSYSRNSGDFHKITGDYNKLLNSRPTAVNLFKGADFVFKYLNNAKNEKEVFEKAFEFEQNELKAFEKIAEYGVRIIQQIYEKKKTTVNILTHCNAGWLACGDWGTALAPIYKAHMQSIPLHVWVDETRPLNQGARLTAWELHNANIDYHIIVDNSAGLLMQKGQVDMVIVGADRIAKNGDFANKVGTYLKALAANANNVPFIVAAPLSTFDFSTESGENIIIEERSSEEIFKIKGKYKEEILQVDIFPRDFRAKNFAFDLTPAHLVDFYLTDVGIFEDIENLKKYVS